MSIWDDIEAQKENAIGSGKDYKKVLKENIDDPLRKYFEDSEKNIIPIEYHTEASSKPVYHPLVMSRVLVYFNPKGLEGKSLEEYSFEWFGMTLDTLKKYVERGWIIVQLNTRDKYDGRLLGEIKEFFHKMEAKPIYVNIVDDSLPSIMGHRTTLEDYLREERKSEEIKRLYKNWRKIIEKPIEAYGVKINDDKVRENYLKLKLLRDVFKERGDDATANAINVELEFLKNTKNSEELAQRAYTSFLIYGTPILYCNGSGFVSVGSEPYWYIVQNNTKTIFGKIKKKLRESIETITMKNQKVLYFDNIEKPHEIIKKHYNFVKKEGNKGKAKVLEDEIIKMIDKVYRRVDEETGNYIKAFESFMNEAIGAKGRIISIPLHLGGAIAGYVLGEHIGSLIGSAAGLIAESRPIKTIALKCVARNKIFGAEIKEKEIPDLEIRIPEAYKEFRYRVFRIPVKNEHHISEELKIAELKK